MSFNGKMYKSTGMISGIFFESNLFEKLLYKSTGMISGIFFIFLKAIFLRKYTKKHAEIEKFVEAAEIIAIY